MTTILTAETLSAYLDGELDPDMTKVVEQKLAESETARQELADLRRVRAVVADSFDDLLNTPTPLALAARVQEHLQGGTAPPADKAAGQWWRNPALGAVAAALVAIVIAFPAGFYTATTQQEARLDDLRRQIQADQQAFAETVALALESHLSGDVVHWHSPQSDSSGSVTPIRTFRNVGGEWCREYREEAVFAGEQRAQRAIACRSAEGQWRTRLVTFDES